MLGIDDVSYLAKQLVFLEEGVLDILVSKDKLMAIM